MRGISKRIINVAAVAAVAATIVVNPVLAAVKNPDRTSKIESFIRKIIRALDTIEIRFPPG
jgi:hypothetical protein